jgi:hypothetical protein
MRVVALYLAFLLNFVIGGLSVQAVSSLPGADWTFCANENQTCKSVSPAQTLISGSGINPLPYGSNNTILVPLPSMTSWKEFAYLAAVPAGRKINQKGSSMIALNSSGIISIYHQDYLKRYRPDYIYSIGPTSGYAGVTQLPCSSLDGVSRTLARFFVTSSQVVISSSTDYPKGLAASALAARLKVPLFFWGSSGLSASVLNTIKSLHATSALIVGNNSTIKSQLSGIGVSATSLGTNKKVLSWMINNGLPVEYLAAVNSNDRTIGYAPKSSLCAPLLAADRNGAVVALQYNTDFNHPFYYNSQTTTRPSGAYNSVSGKWYAGVMSLNAGTYNFVISQSPAGDPQYYDIANIDFNHNGYYGDPGEELHRADIVNINGKRYSISIDSQGGNSKYQKGHLRFTYPTHVEINENLNQYYKILGHPPKYLAMVGLPDVLPFGIVYDGEYPDVSYHITDQVFANVDGDPFYEIAMGRIVAEDVSLGTLLCSRTLTYDGLIGNPDDWADNMALVGTFPERIYHLPHLFSNRGFDTVWWNDPNNQVPPNQRDRTRYSVFVQEDHGWPFGFDGFNDLTDLMAPAVFEVGGCNVGGIDENNYDCLSHEYKDFFALRATKQGAVALNAFVRGTPASKDIGRDNFWNAILYQGATLGEARLYELNTMVMNQNTHYDIDGQVLYGDPALKIYTPAVNPTYRPARLVVNANILTVYAPDNYWVDYGKTWYAPNGTYLYTAPGLAGSIYDNSFEDPAQKYVVAYKTSARVAKITQSSVPIPLGWNGEYKIDEHWDGTRTIYWMVRFDQFDPSKGTFIKKVGQINYYVTVR